VDLRFFAGLTVEETAAVLGVFPETLKLAGALRRRGCSAQWQRAPSPQPVVGNSFSSGAELLSNKEGRISADR
jgi:hypothetical protein